MKTNAMRFLDAQSIIYEVRHYDINNNDLDATHIANNSGIPVQQLFKTLICIDFFKDIIIAVVPANEQLSLKKLEKVAETKDLSLLPINELLSKTGYIRGGCSPLAMKKLFPIFFHKQHVSEEKIWINAGKKGILIKVNFNQLLSITNGMHSDITQ